MRRSVLDERNPAGRNGSQPEQPAAPQRVRLTRMERRRLEEQMNPQPSQETEGSFAAPPRRPEAPRTQSAPRPNTPPRYDVRTPQLEMPLEQERIDRTRRAAPTRKTRKNPKRRGDLLIRLLMLLCIIVFAVSSFLIIRYFLNIWVTRRAGDQLEQAYQQAQQVAAAADSAAALAADPTAEPTAQPTAAPAAEPSGVASAPQARAQAVRATEAPPSTDHIWPRKYPANPTLRVSSVFYELQRQNPDIVGWIKIDGVLEEAVVQRDNDYYLTHNALRQKSLTGALFLDERCDLKSVPTQMLIHGHNMKEGAMFGSLKKYKVKDASFYRDHPFVEFNTIYENSTYVIFAVAEVDLRWNKPNYLPFWEDVRFDTVEEFEAYVKKARDLSQYRCNVEVVPGDRLLTLSTCTGSDDNERLVVMARRMREGEDRLQLNMSIMTTTDR